MARVTWAVIATREAMGLQGYERSVQGAMRDLAPDDLDFATVAVGSLRGAEPGARRVPAGAYQRAPLPLAMLLGATAYRTRGLVHRFDLRIPPSPGPEVVTIHDLPSFTYDDEGVMPRSAAAGARRALCVIVPSTFAADEVCRRFGVTRERVRVIPNGVGAIFGSPSVDAPASKFGVTGRYVVHAAGATERKNLAALADAWRVVRATADVSLVLCGPPDDRRTRLFADVPGAVLVGAQPPSTVAALMAGAAAVVVPSHYEGFGLPALEGMAAGAPVVAARTGALPEVCGDAAVMVEPTPRGLAEGLVRVLDDAALVERLRTAGRDRAADFTWARAAASHLDVYREVLSG